MLPILVRTARSERFLRPTVAELGELVRRIGAQDDYFLVVQRVPDLPNDFIQVWHESGDDYVLEYREPPGRQYQRLLPEPEPVFAAMSDWARHRRGWSKADSWELLEPEPHELEEPGEPSLSAPERALLLDRLRLSIAGGYEGRSELTELAEEYLVCGEHHPVSRAQAGALVDGLWMERVREQEAWEGETDPERLTRAFAALEASGVIAREHFMCCRSCGLGSIGEGAAPDTRGFVFFHGQITDGAAAGSGLTLYYGGFDGSSDTTAAVGHEVVAALDAAGLPAEWNGDPGSGIEVPMDWRKRLTG